MFQHAKRFLVSVWFWFLFVFFGKRQRKPFSCSFKVFSLLFPTSSFCKILCFFLFVFFFLFSFIFPFKSPSLLFPFSSSTPFEKPFLFFCCIFLSCFTFPFLTFAPYLEATSLKSPFQTQAAFHFGLFGSSAFILFFV